MSEASTNPGAIAGPTAANARGALERVGIVAIGRNEGERLRRCFESLPEGFRSVVYVDSASTDGSVALARGRGLEVVELDLTIPFTASRARNAGLRRLRDRWPELSLVQFVDGDCALSPGWLDTATAAIDEDPRIAVVCGRRRERYPDATRYNRLCDMEWDTPVGEAESCGGDALVRVAALAEVGGYDEGFIAGEEPELCARLRARGWRIRRLDAEMTLHDAAITRFRQWWRRVLRAGHAFAQVGTKHPSLHRRNRRSLLVWGALLPIIVLVLAPVTSGWSLALLLAYPALAVRIALGRRRRGDRLPDATLYGVFCVLGKIPEAVGAGKFWLDRIFGRGARLIEYK